MCALWKCGGPKKPLILTVLRTVAPKTTPEGVDCEEDTQILAEKKNQDNAQIR